MTSSRRQSVDWTSSRRSPSWADFPSQQPDSYALASPAALLPIGVDQLIVVGVNDRPDLVDDNRRYVLNAEAAGDSVELMELPDADHFTVIDPSALTWVAIAERLLRRFPPALPAS